jgi:hypothetical protein
VNTSDITTCVSFELFVPRFALCLGSKLKGGVVGFEAVMSFEEDNIDFASDSEAHNIVWVATIWYFNNRD